MVRDELDWMIRPLDPTSSRGYDIEADWILMSTCNFRCEYCYWDHAELGRKIEPPASVERLAAFFDATGLTWLLHLTGGEPFHYPRFAELCELLTVHHTVSINTNADATRRIAQFAEHVDPARVDFINAGLHLDERKRRKKVDTYVENVTTLQERGFLVLCSSVMYPPMFPDYDRTWNFFAEQGVFLIPKVLQGDHFGRSYPAGYTESERQLIIHFSRMAAPQYGQLLAARSEPPTINPLMDHVYFLHGLVDHRQTLCHAGQRFVRIRENGDIRRCGPDDVLGNVVEGRFDRRPSPSLCQELECPYFCEKYRVHA